jgi:hypothetical protein
MKNNLLDLITKSSFSKKKKCQKCNKPKNHLGKSSNVFFCNGCRPNRKDNKND